MSLPTSAFSMSQVTKSPVFFQRRPTFPLVLILSPTYLQKLFLSPLMFLARFNSTRALAFLACSLAGICTAFYYSGLTSISLLWSRSGRNYTLTKTKYQQFHCLFPFTHWDITDIQLDSILNILSNLNDSVILYNYSYNMKTGT